MITIVRFRAPAGQYAVPVDHVLEIRSSVSLIPLPEPRAGVAGLLRRGDDVLTVLSILGAPGDQVIVIDQGGVPFGLLVTEVTAVRAVDGGAIGPPPSGQDGTTVSGVLVDEDEVVLVLDCAALGRRVSS